MLQTGKIVSVIFNDANYIDKVELNLGDYEIIEEHGKTYAVKKKKWYPKTYEECCVLLGAVKDRHYFFTKKDKDDYPNEVRILNVLDDLRRLLICRDAYWKIAGEEMGLGIPWRPDWTSTKYKYCITTRKNKIEPLFEMNVGFIFAFPTKEMRDAFYESFKSEIESCKELL